MCDTVSGQCMDWQSHAVDNALNRGTLATAGSTGCYPAKWAKLAAYLGKPSFGWMTRNHLTIKEISILMIQSQ